MDADAEHEWRMDTKPTPPTKKTKPQTAEDAPAEAAAAMKKPVRSTDTPVKPGVRQVTLAQARALRP
jgi:hypothetical protein